MAPGNVTPPESWLLHAEDAPWCVLWRALVGCLILPTATVVVGEHASAGLFLGYVVAVLLALRVVPGMLRRLLPFSAEVRSVWAARRVLAKRYDSYQWRKLLGIGAGLLIALLLSSHSQPLTWGLALGCLISGGLGSFFWQRRSRGLPSEALQPPRTP